MTLRQTSFLLIAVLGLAMVTGAVFTSPGFFTIDEVIYMLSADVFLDTGQFIVQNGFEAYGSDDQTWLRLLSIGPNGLTPQYPVGSAVFGSAFVALFDVRGFFLMNALAAFGTLFVTRLLALELFEDERIAIGAILLLCLASYFTEYSVGIWPHMVSILSVTTSFWLFLKASQEDAPLLLSALSGFALGVGLLFRVDGVLLLPVIVILAVLYATKPIKVLAGGAFGLIPGLGAMAYANLLKFGTWNPISYGGEYGSEEIFKYLALMAICALAFLATVLVRVGIIRPARVWMLPVIALIIAAAFLVPQVGNMVVKTSRGIIALIVDSTTIVDHRGGVQHQTDGTLLFWGLPKKAMGQSLPWLGCLLILVAWPWGIRRRAIVSILLFTSLWMFPFLIRSWHGGLSLNMRYFLPLLPAISILACWIIKGLMGKTVPRYFLYAIIGGFAATSLWSILLPTKIAGAHQILSTFVFLITCAVAILAGFAKSRLNTLALLMIGLGIGQSIFISASDNMIAQAVRASNMLDFSEGTDKELIYDVFARSVYLDPDQILAVPHWRSKTADPDLVESALEDGYRVLMLRDRAIGFLNEYPRFEILGVVLLQDISFQSIGLR